MMTARKLSQLILIELFAVFQGMSFGVVSILSELLTDPEFHALSLREYNALFITFSGVAVIVTPLGGWLARNGKSYPIFIGGSVLALISMLLMGLTNLFLGNHGITLLMLFGAVVSLGGGFGVLLVILSQWMIVLFPNRRFVALLFLYAALSFGITFSTVFVEYSLSLHKWWLVPALIFGGFSVLLLLFDLFENCPLVTEVIIKRVSDWKIILFLIPSFLYGYIESIIGMWGGGYRMEEEMLSHEKYELFFVALWAIAMLGRVCVAFLIPFVPFPLFYLSLPVVATVAAFYFPSFLGVLILATTLLLPLNLGRMSHHFSNTFLYGLNISLYFLGITVGNSIGSFPFVGYTLVIASLILIVLHSVTLYKTYAQKKGY